MGFERLRRKYSLIVKKLGVFKNQGDTLATTIFGSIFFT